VALGELSECPSWQRCSQNHLTELERTCREEWEKLPKYRYAKLVVSYPRRPKALIAAKGASTKYYVKSLNTYVCDIYVFSTISKNLFLIRHYGVLCVEGKKRFNQF
jgi:hypothetical protein